ncbi:MAG: DUF2752 domain-containing protein [Calditrichaceae bacterium]
MIKVSLKKLSGRQIKNRAAWIFGLSIILVYSVMVNPAESNITICRFHQLTGLDCPTCGISRSFYAFSHFNIAAAFNYHLFGPVLFLIFGSLLCFYLVELILRKKISLSSPYLKFRWLTGTLIGLWFITWIIGFF